MKGDQEAETYREEEEETVRVSEKTLE